jgi:hypothetical protein
MPNTGDRWLIERAKAVTSQYGEDGIIEAALERLPARDRFCVEFGAWGGKDLSNTWNLIRNHEYGAVLIECEPDRFEELKREHAGNQGVHPLRSLVGFDAHDGLDSVLAPTPAPLDFDVLSIDIDGNDYHVWDATRRYRPKLVVIEYNPTVPCGVEFVQERKHGVMQGASLASLIELARQKDYELVATTVVNAFFVDRSYFPAFGISDNSELNLRPDQRWVTHFFTGYDGRTFLRGGGQLPWHAMPLSQSRAQQLPWFLRDWFQNYGPVRRTAWRVMRRWRSMVERHRAAG